MNENQDNNFSSPKNQTKGGDVFRESLWRFLKPLPNQSDENKKGTEFPIVTGFGAIKKNMLEEHGGETLTNIREKNTVMRNALKGNS